jgi:predicted acylesterase/phospholipase RssA
MFLSLAPRRPARFSSLALRVGAMVLAAQLSLTGCATPKRLPAVPDQLVEQAQPIPGPIRFLVLRDTSAMVAEAHASLDKELAWRASQGQQGPLPPASFLAISGGGDAGAYGAGLLNGWSAAGTRPEFKVVTGISTGALIAPFAFLGPRYDPVLKHVYTEVSAKDIFTRRGLLKGFFGDAMADTTPLYRILEHYVDQPLLDEIAAEYAKGRILLVGTTNLDTLEPVIWNMTAIAASKDPQAKVLFRKVLLASASIPGAFPPVLIDVHVNGVHYQEMHVDGGAMTQVFLYPPSVHVGEAAAARGVEDRQRTLYIVRNARLDADWANVKRRTLPIAGRAVVSLMQTQGVGDLYRIFVTTQRDGLDYNLAFIPPTFDTPHTKDFDTDYMRKLFQLGYDTAQKGYPWRKTPPGYPEPKQQQATQAQPQTR